MRRRIRSTSLVAVLMGVFMALATVSACTQDQLPQPWLKDQQVSVSLLLPAQMSPADAQIAAQRQESVARSAQIYGYALDSSYSYREIACPYAPRDILLAYESVSPTGAISRFSAVLSRDGTSGGRTGHSPVQIIPILHFGVTPFVPASSSPHSIDIFNDAVAASPVGRALLSDMQTGRQPLLLRGLCYLAMVGVEPVALRSPSLDAATVQAPGPTLQFVEKGRTRQLISIRNSDTSYQVWTLTFAPDGRLMTAAREEHPVEPTTPVTLQAATPASPSETPSAAGITPTVVAPAAKATTPQAAMASQPESPAVPAPVVAPPAAPAVTVAAPPEPAAPPAERPSTVLSQPAPTEIPPPAEATSTPAQPITSPTTEVPSTPSSAAPPKTLPTEVTAASPQPAAPSTSPAAVMAANPRPAVASPPAVTSLPVVHRDLPEPPHRFIPNPPAPASRIIPASAMQSPPHLSQ